MHLRSKNDSLSLRNFRCKSPAIRSNINVMAAKTGVAPRIRKLKLKHPELTGAEIAKRVGCTPNNVYCVLGTFLGDKSEAELRNYQENQADVFDTVAMRLLSSVTQEKIDKTPAVQAITGAAILIDKARLVRGQATGINVNVLLDVVDAIRTRSAGNPPAASAPTIDAQTS